MTTSNTTETMPRTQVASAGKKFSFTPTKQGKGNLAMWGDLDLDQLLDAYLKWRNKGAKTAAQFHHQNAIRELKRAGVRLPARFYA
jgi:hypothetical protein